MALTDLVLKTIQQKEKPYSIKDIDGLFIHVSQYGSKSWHFRYSWESKQERITLGKYPIVSLQEARTKAMALHALLANGTHPKTKKLTAKKMANGGALTFRMFIPEWKKIKYLKLGLTKPHHRNSTRDQIERYLKKDILPVLGDIPIHQITRQDVLSVLRNMEKRGAFVPAEKVRSWLNDIFKHALVVGHITINPATDMEVVALPKPRVTHNPHLTMDELPEFLAALAYYPGERQIRLALKLLFLTGVRPGELRFSNPEQFDLRNKLWRIPAEKVKQLQRQVQNGEKIPDYLVPLPKQAIKIIKELLKMAYQNQKYLLIGRTDPNKPICENTLNLAIKRIGYAKRLTSHGIRATISTALYELGYEGKFIEGQLSHVDPNPVVRTYNHANYVPQRHKIMQEWADKLDAWEKQGLAQFA